MIQRKDEILEGLNERQAEAVTYGEGALLILAGAGSGKTRVLTHRIAYLIDAGVSSYNFLAVTFTNKAAEEMRGRVRRLVNRDVWVSTFHASCLQILKRESAYIGYARDFAVYDESDQLALIKECLRELSLDDKQYIPKVIREKISRAKDELMNAEELQNIGVTHYDEVIANIYALYEKKLRQYNGIDFGGLIHSCIMLFRNYPDVLEKYQKRFQYILIDEYQDTNHAQYEWVRLLAAAGANLTVVGDPDQSIYGWRGADISNILSFERDNKDTRVVKLEKNYRSTKTILNASNALIGCNENRKEKELWTDSDEGDKITMYQARDERAEAEYVAHTILNLVHDGQSLDDMVVFYRVHAQSRILEDYLRQYNVPYRIIGGVRFYDRKEIKDIIAYLRVVIMPNDEVSLNRIINFPTRGIGKKALGALSAYKNAHTMTLFETFRRVDEIPGISKRAKANIVDFHTLINSLREQKDDLLPSEIVKKILRATGYLTMLENDKTFESRVRIENIKEFIGVMTEYEEKNAASEEESLLSGFLDMVSLKDATDTWDQLKGMLTLMTIHSAKGLEFKTVFIVGLEEDIFPHMNVLESSSRELEEERRLCYVAITRAKEKVYLSYTEKRRLYGRTSHNFPSRFLQEIPQQYVLMVHNSTLVDDIYDFDDEEEDETIIEYDVI